MSALVDRHRLTRRQVLIAGLGATGSLVIGLPATYAFACHMMRLMEKAEG